MFKKGRTKREPIIVSGDQCFWMRDGRVLCGLVDLQAILRTMGGDEFSYHVNKEKNDFARWVEESLGDATLAGQLKKTRTQKGHFDKVDIRLKKHYKI